MSKKNNYLDIIKEQRKQKKTKKNSEGKFEYTDKLEYPTPTRNTPVIIQEPFQNIHNLSL